MADRIVVGRPLPGERAARRIPLELVDERGRSGDPLERGASNELEGRARLEHAHRVAGLRREADELDRLVRGDAAADPEQDACHQPTPGSRRQTR